MTPQSSMLRVNNPRTTIKLFFALAMRGKLINKNSGICAVKLSCFSNRHICK